jgi:hypothetical protein
MSIVVYFLLSILTTAIFFGIAFGISSLFLGGRYTMSVFLGLAAVAVLPGAIAVTIDRRRGARLDRESRLARMIRSIARGNYRAQAIGVTGPIALTISSNVRQSVFYAAFGIAFLGTLGVVFAELLARGDVVTFSGSTYVPEESGPTTIDGQHYETMRTTRLLGAPAPFIQAEVIRDPYIKLFIPYAPERHAAALEARCPALPRLRPRGLHFHSDEREAVPDSVAALALACLAAIHDVRIDGEPVAGLRFDFHRHPRANLDGIVAHIPVAEMARGRHELRVTPAPRVQRPGEAPRTPRPPHMIPFWL